MGSMADESTIENRVYLFKDLAAAYLSANPGALKGAERDAGLAALADLAFVACTLADTEDLDPAEAAKRVRKAP
ncbi:MAG: hypothetical protein CMN30_24555 [Sandaracinus sp.]|nr:hypothetical protein [Sandaracinus sp.]